MALKRHLKDNGDGDMQYYCTTACERGGMAVLATGAFLPEMDASGNVVSYVTTSPSGRVPVGILMHTTEDYDTTRIPYNYQNMDVVPVNSKVYVLKDGEVITNMIDPARLSSIVPGKAYVTSSGLFTDTVPASGGSIDPGSCKFLSGPSDDGYVKVSVKMA